MEKNDFARRYLPSLLWIAAIVAVYLFLSALITPFVGGITLNAKIVYKQLGQLGGFLAGILGGLTIIEVYFYQIFFREPKTLSSKIFTRILQVAFAILALMVVISFLENTDLFKLGDGAVAQFIRAPLSKFGEWQSALVKQKIVGKNNGGIAAGGMVALALLLALAVVQYLSVPRNHRYGLAYLLILPAFLGVLFLIIYPFIFEIKLAFSNASLGTQATKNASYGLQYGWNNLVALFTGPVAKDAKFFEVFGRTILWTSINVTFHLLGGLGLAILLHRPMKLQGFYRTLLVIPWAIPTTIAAMALRNEFDSRYGLFNILLTDLNAWLVNISHGAASVIGIGNLFAWLAAHIGPVSWKQDPFWAFVSILISNIWLGIPFMSVIILGGLQSISQVYYEAAEIDGATKWQQFRNITLPLLRPVLTPAIVLGVVWTFNKFDIIYLITQGGPQEKTDILVSSMYKAAFQFYRYGFTAMFALVIFVILFLFTLFYLRISGGLKSATE
ncbi:MAG: sugar ABC transporter permease [Anaerolineales bacterium]|nr:sugar ABC transporter permease [Anaerolineales bacterium]